MRFFLFIVKLKRAITAIYPQAGFRCFVDRKL